MIQTAEIREIVANASAERQPVSDKLTPLDIESILSYGVGRWQREFVWPVSWLDFLELEKKTRGVLNRHLSTARNEALRNLILIDYKIFIEYANFLHTLLVLKKAGAPPLISQASGYLKGMIDNEVPGEKIIAIPKIKKIFFLKYWLRYVVLFLKNNKFRLYNPAMPNVYLLDESHSRYTIEHLQRKYLGNIFTVSFSRLYQASEKYKVSQEEYFEIDVLVKSIVAEVLALAVRYDVALSLKQYEYLVSFSRNLFVSTYELFKSVEKQIAKKNIKHLFIGSNNSLISRIISVAVRQEGGKVYGFTHGEPLIYDWDKISWLELTLNDEYFEYTRRLASTLQRTTNLFPPPNGNRVEIKNLATDFFKKIYRNSKTASTPIQIKKVMFVANEYVREGYLSQVSSFPNPIQLDFELKLMRILLNAEFEVLYKRHPGGALKGKTIDFFPKQVQVIDSPFEEVLHDADLFIFSHSRTSTFGPALCTNKPIIILDGGWESFHPEVRKDLEKRCVFVKAEFVDNRINIDEAELLRAIGDSKERVTTEFYELYLKN